MRKIESIKEIQQEELKILIEFDKICREYNLTYSLAYGTLIGAIRHRGFIPWDDDIDVIMPRPDMDKFIDIIHKTPNSNWDIMNIYDYKNFYAGLMLKFYNKNTIMYELPDKYDLKYGIFIDIFPADGTTGNIEIDKQRFEQYKKIRKKLHFHKAMHYKKNSIRKNFTLITDIWAKKNIEKLNNFFYDIPFNTSDNVVVYPYTPSFESGVFPRNYFDSLIDVYFEGHKFKAFSKYHKYLTNAYGDYMTPPDESNRFSLHNYIAYVK